MLVYEFVHVLVVVRCSLFVFCEVFVADEVTERERERERGVGRERERERERGGGGGGEIQQFLRQEYSTTLSLSGLAWTLSLCGCDNV